MTEKRTKKKRKGNKSKTTITFDEETVTKNVAHKLVEDENNIRKEVDGESQIPKVEDKKRKSVEDSSTKRSRKKQKKIKHDPEKVENGIPENLGNSKQKTPQTETTEKIEIHENEDDSRQKSKKPKKRKAVHTEPANEPTEVQNELDPKKPEIHTEQSIRARKRHRYAELLAGKKLQQEVNIQQKCLNYLSMWKHSRSEWKFEKLRQVWLSQNLFDDAKIPEKFFDILVEYFDSGKGKVRQEILDKASKVVDGMERSEEKEGVVQDDVKYERARIIVQNLQE